MDALIRIIDRVLPSLLMAASVTLLTAGLLSYAPSAFGDWQTPEPLIGGGDPLFSVSPLPSAPIGPTSPPTPASSDPASTANPATADPGVVTPQPSTLDLTPTPRPDATNRPTNPPTIAPASEPPATASPGNEPTRPPSSSRPTAPARGIASRIRIPSMNIDLPVVPSDLVVPGNRDFYPLCDVAMSLRGFAQPGQNGSTYIYAHAQRGMFLPLLRASLNNDGASMIGALVEVYTADNELHLYEIFRVKRHATDLSLTEVPPGVHQLVLQTSEGTAGHVPKLQVAARPIAVVPASPSEANPRPRPRVCLPPR